MTLPPLGWSEIILGSVACPEGPPLSLSFSVSNSIFFPLLHARLIALLLQIASLGFSFVYPFLALLICDMGSGPRWPGSNYVVLKEVPALCLLQCSLSCKIGVAWVEIGWIPQGSRGHCLAQSRCLSICHAVLHVALGIGPSLSSCALCVLSAPLPC